MNLFQLPTELLQIISNYLPRNSLSRLCSSCKIGYEIFLPILYKHIELGHRTQIKQLEQGIMNNAYLKETVTLYTEILTLKSRQGGNSYTCIISLFEQLPNIKRVNFKDFFSLSINKIKQILLCLPQLSRIDFRYCDLISTSPFSTDFILPSLVEINLVWTDFTADAIKQLFHFAPNLNQVSLSANHNRTPLANDSSLHLLGEYCPKIQKLSISLQQVKEASICKVIKQYGTQLTTLSIRCQGNETLDIIAKNTKNLQQLIIRCNQRTVFEPSIINHILQQCKHLNHFELIGWSIDEMPTMLLHSTMHPKRNLALDKHELQELRKLYDSSTITTTTTTTK